MSFAQSWTDKHGALGAERAKVRTLVDYEGEAGRNGGPLQTIRVPAGVEAIVSRISSEDRRIAVEFIPLEFDILFWGDFGWDEVEIIQDDRNEQDA
jgi:hypothetical protein